MSGWLTHIAFDQIALVRSQRPMERENGLLAEHRRSGVLDSSRAVEVRAWFGRRHDSLSIQPIDATERSFQEECLFVVRVPMPYLAIRTQLGGAEPNLAEGGGGEWAHKKIDAVPLPSPLRLNRSADSESGRGPSTGTVVANRARGHKKGNRASLGSETADHASTRYECVLVIGQFDLANDEVSFENEYLDSSREGTGQASTPSTLQTYDPSGRSPRVRREDSGVNTLLDARDDHRPNRLFCVSDPDNRSGRSVCQGRIHALSPASAQQARGRRRRELHNPKRFV
jgi:hypothetical protein